MGYSGIEPQSDEDFNKINKNRQVINKVESFYSNKYQIESTRNLLNNTLKALINLNVDLIDKHLIKDLRRHIDRLNSIKKQMEKD